MAIDSAPDATAALLRQLTGIASICCALLAAPAQADVVIPVGGSMGLSSGGLDAYCTDLIIAGTLQTNSAPVFNVRDVVIQSGGVIDGGLSTINLSGNWTNNGTFTASTSTVIFGDSCGVNPAAISGNTTFNNLSFVSSSGKTWQFAPGSVQTVLGLLTVQGAPGNPVQLTNGGSGPPAYIDPLGGQAIANVDTNNVILGPVVVPPIPMLDDAALLVLMLLLGTSAALTTRSRRARRN